MKPAYYPGDMVAVKNYRKRPPVWENGRVLRAETDWRAPDICRVSYEILLDRKSLNGKLIRLYVSADQVGGQEVKK